MNSTLLTVIALAVSGGIYIFIAWQIHRKSVALKDLLPIGLGSSQARVQTSTEFSAATVATTISLATVILAYSELASYMGTWLLWTVCTTAIGIYVVRLFAPVIWLRLAETGDYRPTLHDFLGTAFGSDRLARIAALCTSLGFIGALAVELSVGSRFLSGLIPGLPAWVAVTILSAIGVTYTMLGGFRGVIITDRIQMWAIWLAIAALGALMLMQIVELGGLPYVAQKMPVTVYDFSWRDGLAAFLLGIAVINIPTFLADMSIWQRIAGTKDQNTVNNGLLRSVVSAAFSWTMLATLACLLVILVVPKDGENPLLTFLKTISQSPSFITATLFLVSVAGLYAASLSTASTQLIAAGHALHVDLIRKSTNRTVLANSSTELTLSRWVLLGSASVALLVVEILRAAGFSIADLVFAVYGAQLGMVPAVVAGILMKKVHRIAIGKFVVVAVLLGFASGWGSAGFGKATDNGDLVFLSPLVSLLTSSGVLLIGFIYSWIQATRSGNGHSA
ncbi:MAG: hypothetical protein V4454_01195 [Pseudomonadota bacterium]